MNTPPPLIPGRRPPNFKVLGWLLIVLGLFLGVFMGWITHFMVGVVNAPTEPGSLPHWTGSHEITVRMFWLFGTVILFGVVSFANGIWCLRHRAFQPVLRLLMLLLGVALFVGAWVVSQTPK